MNYLDITSNSIKNNKYWVVIAAVIFFGSAVILGLLTSHHPEIVEELYLSYFDEIEQMGQRIFSVNPIYGTVVLFWNNLTTAIVMMIFGVILGLPTFFILMINGGALGVLATMLSLQGENPIPFYLLGVLPHGVFEIPAILIAGGFGMKLGYQLLSPKDSTPRGVNFKENVSLGLKLFPAVLFLLAVAAIIEIFITPMLLGLIVDI